VTCDETIVPSLSKVMSEATELDSALVTTDMWPKAHSELKASPRNPNDVTEERSEKSRILDV
jgi:hypothetical protein